MADNDTRNSQVTYLVPAYRVRDIHGTDVFVRFHSWWLPTSDPEYFLKNLSTNQLAKTSVALDGTDFMQEWVFFAFQVIF